MDAQLRKQLDTRAVSLGFDSAQALLRYVSKAVVDNREVTFGQHITESSRPVSQKAPTGDLDLPIPLAQLQTTLKEHGVARASIFGSYARGTANSKSDVDLLVAYEENASLFDHFELQAELERITGKAVDIVSEKSVSKHMLPHINEDKVQIF